MQSSIKSRDTNEGPQNPISLCSLRCAIFPLNLFYWQSSRIVVRLPVYSSYPTAADGMKASISKWGISLVAILRVYNSRPVFYDVGGCAEPVTRLMLLSSTPTSGNQYQ